jgi:hypothetical protein
MGLRDKIYDSYYTFLLKHPEHMDILRDKTFELILKLPIVLGIHFVVVKSAALFGIHFSYPIAVYQLMRLRVPSWAAFLVQLLVYWLALDPIFEFLTIIITEK